MSRQLVNGFREARFGPLLDRAIEYRYMAFIMPNRRNSSYFRMFDYHP
jgi:hypothetical protein